MMLSPAVIAWLEFSLCAALIAVAGTRLSRYGDIISDKTGLGGAWIGLALMATVTTLPEIAVTVSALRIGALDLAISNLFNLAITAIDDVFYVKGPLLAHVSGPHAVSALSVVMMSGVAVVGLLYRPLTRLFRTVGWTSLLLLCIYPPNTFFLYLYGG